MTDPSPEVLQLVTQWVAYAEEDLRTAEYLLTMDRDCPVRSVCFHSQQCIEKYLKAVLTCRSVEFPKIHDTGELLALIPAGLPLSWTPEDQRRITDYATVREVPGRTGGDRYPGGHGGRGLRVPGQGSCAHTSAGQDCAVLTHCCSESALIHIGQPRRFPGWPMAFAECPHGYGSTSGSSKISRQRPGWDSWVCP